MTGRKEDVKTEVFNIYPVTCSKQCCFFYCINSTINLPTFMKSMPLYFFAVSQSKMVLFLLKFSLISVFHSNKQIS